MATNRPATLKSTIKETDLTYHELLGHGARGEVYRVTWKSKKLGKVEAAAKKIPLLPDKSNDEQIGNDIYILQELKHPNIVEYYGQVVTSSHVVLVTEYAAKGSLYDYLKDKTHLPPGLKNEWMIQTAKGIKYLRENNVLYVDLKSPNILITADYNLKICDFGIAKYLTSTKTDRGSRDTIRWLAPEVFADEALSPKADVFAFGIILWELETCEEPYEGKTVEQVTCTVGNEDLRPEIPKNCPSSLKSLMQQCWDKDRNKRPDVHEIISQLESIQSRLIWHLQHTIRTGVTACYWVSHQQLAVCKWECVEVYEVTTEGSHLAYQLTSDEWKGKYTMGVAVSEFMPDSILVVCYDPPYVYQYPRHQAIQQIKKYKIQRKDVNTHPRFIVANASTAVIALSAGNTLVICSLPNFNRQSHIQTSIDPYDLSITTDYLLVMGDKEMIVKLLGDRICQDLCKIVLPHRWNFRSVCLMDNAKLIYAACWRGGMGCVYKYTWDGVGKPQYVNGGCVIDGLGDVGFKRLSMGTDGCLAVGEWYHYKLTVYSLE